MTRRDIPNLLTLLRILLVAPLAWALLEQTYGLVLALFLVAAFTDGLDGFLARHFGWQSPLGAILDPLADKLMLVTIYAFFGLQGFLPWWLVAAVVGRDLVIVGGALTYRLLFGRVEMAPTFVSKLNTVMQILLALVAILALGLGWLPPWSADLLVYAVLASTLLSGLHYVAVWAQRAWKESGR